jgi:hypothetical protein
MSLLIALTVFIAVIIVPAGIIEFIYGNEDEDETY